MNIFYVDKIMRRLDQMLDNAITGNPIEHDFDETKMSALETKLSHYLSINQSGRQQLAAEKLRINQLISDISHQTKTPLANILLYAQLLEESNLSGDERLCVNSLAAQAEKLNFLIASLMKASRLESGILVLTPSLQQVQPMIDSVLKQLDVKAKSKNIAAACIQTDADAVFDLKWTVEAIYNIMDNAVKYTPEGGAVTVSVIPYQLFCRIDISDTGIGISEDDTAKIFTRFYRSPQVSDVEGVGIGLYLAREIIGGQGGYIKVSSAPGKGSVFSVFIPKEG